MDPLHQVLHSHNEYMRLVLGFTGYRELMDGRHGASTAFPDSEEEHAEFFAKVAEDEREGRLVNVVVMGQVARTTVTEYEAGRYEGKARLATDQESDDELERARLLHELHELQRPSSPLPS
jgi:antirestriction protein